jgi:hypothetical protein
LLSVEKHEKIAFFNLYIYYYCIESLMITNHSYLLPGGGSVGEGGGVGGGGRVGKSGGRVGGGGSVGKGGRVGGGGRVGKG